MHIGSGEKIFATGNNQSNFGDLIIRLNVASKLVACDWQST